MDMSTPAVPEDEPRERWQPLWSAIDWTLWGSGMADTFREPLTDKMLAALSDDEKDQALEIMASWRARRGKQGWLAEYEDLRAERNRLRAGIESLRRAAERIKSEPGTLGLRASAVIKRLDALLVTPDADAQDEGVRRG